MKLFGLTELLMRLSCKNMLLIIGVVKEIIRLSCWAMRGLNPCDRRS